MHRRSQSASTESSSSSRLFESCTRCSSVSTSSPPNISLGESCLQIPTEIFLAAATFLCERDLVVASQVCRPWRAALFANTKLWLELDICLLHPAALHKTAWWCRRAGQSLAALHITFDLVPNIQQSSAVTNRYTDLLWVLHDNSCVNIAYIHLQLLTHSLWSLYALNQFASVFLQQQTRAALLSNLDRLQISLSFAYCSVYEAFFLWFPDIAVLQVCSIPAPRSAATMPPSEVPEESFHRFLSGALPQQSLPDSSGLEELLCIGICLTSSVVFPRLPCLRYLTFRKVSLATPFWYLLRAVAGTLEGLSMDDYVLDEAVPPVFQEHATAIRVIRYEDRLTKGGRHAEEDYEDELLHWAPDEDEEELLMENLDRLTIEMERLQTLECRGPRATNFWYPAEVKSPLWPSFAMPRLKIASLCDMNCLDDAVESEAIAYRGHRTWRRSYHDEDPEDESLSDYELSVDEDEEDYNVMDSLWALCKTSRSVYVLDLQGSRLSDACLAGAIPHLNNLSTLNLRGTHGLSGSALYQISRCLPFLNHLDIRGTRICAISVAETTTTIRSLGGKLAQVYMDDPGPFYTDDDTFGIWLAYKWLEFVGVVVDWAENGRSRQRSKTPWGTNGKRLSLKMDLRPQVSIAKAGQASAGGSSSAAK